MFTVMLLMPLLMADAPSVRLSDLDGQVVEGALTGITAEAITVETVQGTVSVPSAQILELDLPVVRPSAGEAPAESGLQQVLLHDGGRLSGSQVTRSAQKLELRSELSVGLEIPSADVRAVRLQPRKPALDDQWNTFLQRDDDKDLLIVVGREGEGLDFLSGIVGSISDSEVSFLLDGDRIPVPTQRVFGIVFAAAKPAQQTSPIILEFSAGDRLSATGLTCDGQTLQIQTSWKQQITLPLTQVRRIDFSSGRIRYLSDEEPIRVEFFGIDPEGSIFAGLLDQETARLLYGPQRDKTIDARAPIRLRGRKFEKGLCLHSKTELSYALDQKFSVFEALAGVDDEVAFNQSSRVLLRITGDGTTLFEQDFATADEPVRLKLPVAGMATLTILVDYSDGDSSCDWLDLADARLILATKDK